MKYWQYLKYVVRHKWYVMWACFGERLLWLGIVHDLSKLLPSEFIPYANFFYGYNPRDETGYYKPTDTGDMDFDFAWLLHQKRNKHHWQWWILPEDDGGFKVLEMPDKYLREMICDWTGASMAQGFGKTIKDWYSKNNHKMKLHPKTREEIERRFHA